MRLSKVPLRARGKRSFRQTEVCARGGHRASPMLVVPVWGSGLREPWCRRTGARGFRPAKFCSLKLRGMEVSCARPGCSCSATQILSRTRGRPRRVDLGNPIPLPPPSRGEGTWVSPDRSTRVSTPVPCGSPCAQNPVNLLGLGISDARSKAKNVGFWGLGFSLCHQGFKASRSRPVRPEPCEPAWGVALGLRVSDARSKA